MGIFAKLFNKNSEEVSSRNVEDFVSLTRVYFQSVIAANLGITNIRFVPDVANFKRLFKSPHKADAWDKRKSGFPQDADAGLRHQRELL